ncbi:hypothetical protein FRB99_001983 [Tulasnella sp. 403]|nr:hypothetical protein FRB99_001983 [Tulasnella sp. 403]
MSQSQKTTRRSGLKDGDAAASPGSPDGHPPSPFSCNLADYGSMDAPDAVKTLRLLFTHVSSSPNRRFTKDYLSVANRLVEILEDSMSSQSNPMEARLSSIEASLSKVTNILSSQSFAPPPPVVTQPAAPLVKERTSKGNTRGANDVVISTARVNKEHVILKSNPVELSTLVQNAIRNCGVAELAGIEIHSVKTLRRDQIMVRARCDQEAKLILEQADKWTEKLAEGAKVSKEQYKVVASRVPTTFDPSAMTAKDVIHQSNKILIPRARGDAGPVKSHSSLIITMDDKSAADELILRGVSIGGMLCDVHRATTAKDTDTSPISAQRKGNRHAPAAQGSTVSKIATAHRRTDARMRAHAHISR